MAQPTLRIGLIGAGKNTQARHIPGLRALSEVELVAVCNRRPASTHAVAREFAVRDKDIIFVSDADFAGVYKAFAGISNVTGPIITGFLTCQSTKC